MAAELEVGVDSALEGCKPEILEFLDLALGEGLVREVCKRRATPEGEARTKRVGGMVASPAARVRPPSMISRSNRTMSMASGSTLAS
jgi:hypothetical protein